MIKVEVCVESLESVLTAQRAGAHRVELNSGIGLGGLTPTLNLLKQVRVKTQLPIICMVRPRAGDFCYTEHELELMLVEAKVLMECGADGLAIGVLDAQRRVSQDAVAKFKDICGDGELVFHRAFDCVVDLWQAASELIKLGVDRILTSGGQNTAMAGKAQLADLQSEFGHQIEILPGSGIRSSNVAELVESTGCQQVHGTFATTVETGSLPSDINFNEPLGLASNQKKETNLEELNSVLSVLQSR